MEVKQGSGDDTSSEGSKSTEPAGAGSETDRSYGYGDPSDEAVQETTTDYRLLPLLPELEHRLLRAPVSDNDIVVIKVGSRKEECDIVLNMPALRVHDVHFEVIREQSSVDILVHADLYLDGTLIRGPHSRHNLLNTMAIGVPVKDDDLGFCNVFIAYLGKPPLPDHGRSEIDRAFYTSKELGSGAYGVVLLAHEKESFQARALKFVKRKLLSKDPEKESLAAFARFDESLKVTTIEKEEKILQRLSHSNIISNFKYPCEGDPILSMEYMTGGTLQERIDAFPSGIEPHYLKVYFYQVFEAVKYLHSQKIAHCDIKPANILMKSNARSTTVKLSDFGLCRILSEEDMDAEERLRSTAGFLPPHTELIAVKFMKQIDLFALLISLCQCASSSPKFTCVGTPFYQTGNDYFDAIKSTISTLDMDPLTLQLALFILNAYYVEKKDVAHVLTQSDWFQDNAIKEEVYKLCI